LPDSKPIQYRILDRLPSNQGDEREGVVAALLESPAKISPKYFYDELGCALYGAICQLPEYYPTRTEHALFREHRSSIAESIGKGRQFVDLGAGDCCKGQAWLPFLDPARYVAVDIAGAELEKSLARMAPDFPEIEMIGVIADFTRGLPLGDILDSRPVAFFYPGSSIGNFTPGDAVKFLALVQAECAARPGSGLLIGVDGKKAPALLDAAYDDALGVTASFNRNVLLHLNRRFGFDFALQALRDQSVSLGSRPRQFSVGERIHTENSYKYAGAEFEALLRSAGFRTVRRWATASDGYMVFHAA